MAAALEGKSTVRNHRAVGSLLYLSYNVTASLVLVSLSFFYNQLPALIGHRHNGEFFDDCVIMHINILSE